MAAPSVEHHSRFGALPDVLPIQQIEGPVANRSDFITAATLVELNEAQGSNTWRSLGQLYVSYHLQVPERRRTNAPVWPLEYGALHPETRYGRVARWVLGDLGVGSLGLSLEMVDAYLARTGPERTYAHYLPPGMGRSRLLICRQVVEMLGDGPQT